MCVSVCERGSTPAVMLREGREGGWDVHREGKRDRRIGRERERERDRERVSE